MGSFRVSPLEPKGPADRMVYGVSHAALVLIFRTLFRLRLADTRSLPDGPVILAANHRSFLDPLLLGSAVDRPITYMMHGRYYDKPALNWFFRACRCIVVDDDSDNRSALRQARQVLERGEVVGIFPEGHISPDGLLQPAQPGIAWLARKSAAPVFPVHLGGTREALCKGSRRLRLARLSVSMGDPLRVEAWAEGRSGNEAFTEAIMDAIAALGGLTRDR
jgi:1-acyl-sn-glycerol-3-phosphate acyltransferase